MQLIVLNNAAFVSDVASSILKGCIPTLGHFSTTLLFVKIVVRPVLLPPIANHQMRLK